jgi:hypothetical protein
MADRLRSKKVDQRAMELGAAWSRPGNVARRSSLLSSPPTGTLRILPRPGASCSHNVAKARVAGKFFVQQSFLQEVVSAVTDA